MYISGGKPELKHAHISIFRARKRVQRDLTNVVVANVHLDAAGGNTHRANQMACVAQALRKYARAADVVIVAGDTNCFELNREKQAEMLQGIMTPLVDNGLCDVFDSSGYAPTDTHYFKRARTLVWLSYWLSITLCLSHVHCSLTHHRYTTPLSRPH